MPGAIAVYREAIRINPTRADDHYSLAAALERSGDPIGEIAEIREALRVERLQKNPQGGAAPDASDAPFDDCYLDAASSGFLDGVSMSFFTGEVGYTALGNGLAEMGDLSGAIEAYIEAIRLGESGNPGSKAAPHAYLGHARRLAGDLPGAIAAYRDAIRLDPEQSIEARYCLGLTLAESGELPGAIGTLREAIQHDHLHRVGPFRFLRGIVMAPRPDDAVRVLRRVRDQARNDTTISRAIDIAISQFEQLSKLGVRIPTNFRDAYGGGNFAAICYDRRFYSASAAIWSAGFATDLKLADDMGAQNHYNAACSAALAAVDKGIDKPLLDDQAKARWRHQALDWLKADLAHWSKQIETGMPEAKALSTKTLQHWKTDRDLAGIRDEDDVAKLSEPERKEWQAFWAEVAALLKNADPN